MENSKSKEPAQWLASWSSKFVVKVAERDHHHPKDHLILKTGDFEDPTPAIQVLGPFDWRVQDP